MTTSSIDVTQHPLYDIANEYQRQALRTEPNPPPVFVVVSDPAPLSRLLHAALGICTEGGELQDQIKKHLIYGRPLDATNLVEECGDVLWYVALALDAIGVTMTDCMARNIEKLRARFPERFTQAQANERDLDAERAALAKPVEPPKDDVYQGAERLSRERRLMLVRISDLLGDCAYILDDTHKEKVRPWFSSIMGILHDPEEPMLAPHDHVPTTDRERLDWLTADETRLKDVFYYASNEGVDVREAIDYFARLAASAGVLGEPKAP